jgi:glycosyltransferase involved in cell wall biosynthesis
VLRLVSVVLPIHNEEESLAGLLGEIGQALAVIPHEIIAVDDASTDGSLARLRQLSPQWPALRVVSLRRRAGQSAAMAAGMDAAEGDVIATMDADGQHDPADLPRLLSLLDGPEAPTAVVGFRSRRSDGRWVRWQSAFANAIRDFVTGDRVRDSACSFRVMRRAALETVPRFDGMHRFLPSLLRLQGGTVIEVPIAHRPRLHGRSKYGTLDRAMRGLVDVFGVRWLRRRALRYEVREDRSGAE